MSAPSKETVLRLYRAVAGAPDTLDAVVAETYTPHLPRHKTMPALPAGRTALARRLRETGPIGNSVKRIIADGACVFAQMLFDGAPPVNGVDIFRFDDTGRIADHWALRQPLAGESAATIAGRFDGGGNADAPVPREQVARNRTRAHDLYAKMWAKGRADLVRDFHAPSYVQHNPHIASGAARIEAILSTAIRGYIDTHGTDFPIILRHIGAEGDLVFGHTEIRMAGLGRNDGDTSSIVDIFRVDDDGLFAEHWDVCHMESDKLPDFSTLF